MNDCKGFEEKYLNYISNSLQTLELAQMQNIKGNHFINLSNLSNLKINWFGNKSFETFPPNIKCLTFENCGNLNPSILNILPSNLKSLNLSYNSNLSVNGTKYFPKSLQDIKLSKYKLNSLIDFVNLHSLYLSNCELNEELFKTLSISKSKKK